MPCGRCGNFQLTNKDASGLRELTLPTVNVVRIHSDGVMSDHAGNLAWAKRRWERPPQRLLTVARDARSGK